MQAAENMPYRCCGYLKRLPSCVTLRIHAPDLKYHLLQKMVLLQVWWYILYFFISKLIIVLFACFNKKKQTPAE